jgi:hypothetical protein
MHKQNGVINSLTTQNIGRIYKTPAQYIKHLHNMGVAKIQRPDFKGFFRR